jgi:hypothetical protein
MSGRKRQRATAPVVRLSRRNVKLLRLISSRPRSAEGLRAELYGSNGTRLTVTESRNVTAGLAVLGAMGLVSRQSDGAYAITRLGRTRLERA